MKTPGWLIGGAIGLVYFFGMLIWDILLSGGLRIDSDSFGWVIALSHLPLGILLIPVKEKFFMSENLFLLTFWIYDFFIGALIGLLISKIIQYRIVRKR